MAKMGRPEIEIDWDQFEKLCQLHCTLNEIAGFFSCSHDTIERKVKERYGKTFAYVWDEKSAAGKVSIRRKQFEMALKGNVNMLRWLGQNILNQTDSVEHRLKAEIEQVQALTDEQLLERAKEVAPLLIETLARPKGEK
jgi:hypothetical protein